MFPNRNVGQNHNLNITNIFFENMANFKYLGATVTNQYLIHEENKSRSNSSNACHH
jgi:hypothetical protein